jgi:signal transduction histidine kinase
MNRKSLEPEMHERLGLIDEQLHRIQRTLRELVQFSRPGSEERTRFDIRDVIDNSLDIAKYYKRKKGRQILTHYAEELLPVFGKRDQILQVFLNLILNALDATEEGGTIQISTRREDGRLKVTVEDDGCGIGDIDQEKLFEPYFTTKPTGTGLGLFVSRNVLRESGGRIDLTSSSANGTTFTVTLPLAGG